MNIKRIIVGTGIRHTMNRMSALKARVSAKNIETEDLFTGTTYYPAKIQTMWRGSKFFDGYLTREELSAGVQAMADHVKSVSDELKLDRDVVNSRALDEGRLSGLRWSASTSGFGTDVDGLNAYLDTQDNLLNLLRRGKVQEFFESSEKIDSNAFGGPTTNFCGGEYSKGGIFISLTVASIARARSEAVERIMGGDMREVKLLIDIGVKLANKPNFFSSTRP